MEKARGVSEVDERGAYYSLSLDFIITEVIHVDSKSTTMYGKMCPIPRLTI